IELPILESVIESVTGHNAPSSMIDQKGLELDQSNPTIIAFTSATREFGAGYVVNSRPSLAKVDEKVYTIIVDFNELIPVSSLAGAPFNPFIFINNTRGRECHLKGMEPTAKADLSLYGSYDDDTSPEANRYYVSDNNVPFAINIAHQFRYPAEGERIDRAYNHFLNWGQSNGTVFNDWYSDASGYRNLSRIYMK
ncbi:MAG: DUF4842 domain-containing protein, partial [Ekhidna sp.]|nr:DUF4842 domain-containing protein [Ekhidna sp.]